MRSIWPVFREKPAYLLLVAAVFHVTVVVAVRIAGGLGLVPGLFDQYGFGGFATDNPLFRAQMGFMAETLSREGVSAWLDVPAYLHVRIFSVAFALLGPLFGYTVLAAEPVNLACYLAVVALVFTLGREVFDRRVGFVAATLVALWPSFLLQTTQLYRDPLFVAGMLGLVLCIVKLLTGEYTLRRGAVVAVAGAAAGTLAWVARVTMDEMVVLISVLGVGLLALRALREQRLLAANMVGAVLLVGLVFAGDQIIPRFVNVLPDLWVPAEKSAPAADERPEPADGEDPPSADGESGGEPGATPGAESGAESGAEPGGEPGASGIKSLSPEDGAPTERKPPSWEETPLLPGAVDNVVAQVSYERLALAGEFPDAGSNYNADVQFDSVPEMIRYLPTAAAVGFFAPFPDTWFVAGSVAGLAAKLVSGLETLAMYALELLAVAGLWLERRRFSAWLLAMVSTTGVILLATVFVNVGTLYRQRYFFWMLLIVLGAMGAVRLYAALSAKRKPKPETE